MDAQDEAITRCCEMPLPLQEWQAHFQESEGKVRTFSLRIGDCQIGLFVVKFHLTEL